jgi:quercetin dioxygenase-like cupin family protein
MNFEGSFRHIGSIDVEPLARAVEGLGEDAWFEYVRRQERFAPHRYTHTIPLLFDEDMRHSDPTAWPRFAEMETAMRPVMDAIREANPAVNGVDDGYFVRIILTRLNPGAPINPHRDHRDSIVRSHRNHVAISTNKLVEFWIDGETRHLAPGEIWEINNRRKHAVRNLSDQARVHLILDYVVPGEEVHDVDEGLVVA